MSQYKTKIVLFVTGAPLHEPRNVKSKVKKATKKFYLQTRSNLAPVGEFRGRLLFVRSYSCGCKQIHVHQFNVHTV